MHGLFGSPKPSRTGEFELFVSNARNLAAQHLGPSLDDLEQRAGVQDQVHAIKTNFWDGFVVAHFQGPQTSESESFWRCLSLQYPGLAQGATDAFNMNAMASPAYTAAKLKTVRASRLLFTTDMDSKTTVRYVSVRFEIWQLIPGSGSCRFWVIPAPTLRRSWVIPVPFAADCRSYQYKFMSR